MWAEEAYRRGAGIYKVNFWPGDGAKKKLVRALPTKFWTKKDKRRLRAAPILRSSNRSAKSRSVVTAAKRCSSCFRKMGWRNFAAWTIAPGCAWGVQDAPVQWWYGHNAVASFGLLILRGLSLGIPYLSPDLCCRNWSSEAWS